MFAQTTGFAKARLFLQERMYGLFLQSSPWMDPVLSSALYEGLQLEQEHCDRNHVKPEHTTRFACVFAGVIDPPFEKKTPPSSFTEEKEEGLQYLVSIWGKMLEAGGWRASVGQGEQCAH